MTADLHVENLQLAYSLGLAFLFLGVVLLVGMAVLSRAHQRPYSAAMAYLAAGIGAGLFVRFTGIGHLANPVGNYRVDEFVTDGALALGLFATGMRIRRPLTLGGWQSPLRLLGIAMPLTIAFVALWGWGLLGLGVGGAIVLGTALAPTDPVLAGGLGVEPPATADDAEREAEERTEEHRFVLTAEGGLNDGVALPALLLGVAIASNQSVADWAWAHLAYGIAVGVAVGALMGWALAEGTNWLREVGFISGDFDRWIGLASAFAVFGAAESVGAIGFLACFAGGVAFRRRELQMEFVSSVHDGADVITRFAELAAMLLLGSSIVAHGFSFAGTWGMALAPVAIVVMRPLAALCALVGAPALSFRQKLWVGWFGVKGVASMNYVALIVAAAAFGHETRQIVWSILFTITCSVFLHGITSEPLTRLLIGERRDD